MEKKNFFNFTIVIVMMFISMAFVSADISILAHDADVTLAPEWSTPNDVNDYVMSIYNQGPDNIREVRIYKNPLYENFNCMIKDTWSLNYETSVTLPGSDPDEFTEACFYKVTNITNPFVQGTTVSFNFSATTPAEAGSDTCGLEWAVETLDNEAGSSGVWRLNYGHTNIDSFAPVISSEVSGIELGTCTSENETDPCYIRRTNDGSNVTINVEETNVCNSGIEKCVYRIYRNGVFLSETTVNGNEYMDLSFDVPFEQDSNHTLVIVCEDVAGNEATLTNYFVVDSTAPETEHHVNDPYYYNSSTGIHYLNGESTIYLTSTDNKFDQNGITTYYELHNASGLVESGTYNSGDEFGPFDNEGVYTLKFWSVDDLGNTENENTYTFTVDKTAPVMTKLVGEPKVPFYSGYDYDVRYTQFTDDELALWITDRKFPTGGVDSVSAFGRDNVLKISLDSDSADNGQFYRTEGIQKVGDFGTSIQADLYLDFVWENIPVRAGLWGNAVDDRGPADGPWAILEFTTSGSDDYVGWRAWASGLGWINLENVSFDYGTWNTLSIVLDVDNQEFIFYINGVEVFVTASDQLNEGDATYFSNIVLNAYNYGLEDGEDYTVHWSMLGNVVDWYITSSTDITLSCDDELSGLANIFYRFGNRQNVGDNWNWYSNGLEGWVSTTGDVTFNFPQSSEHILEWYCVDNVEKTSETSTQYYRVDNTAPEIVKEVVGPHQIGDCPPAPNSDEVCYISNYTNVTFFAHDGDAIHAVHGVMCKYEVEWNNEILEEGTWNEGDEIVVLEFENDSEHKITIECKDALGNKFTDVETFRVDITPPVTTKVYGQPMVWNGTHRWITSNTPITLTSTDNKVGVEEIFWRYKWVGNYTCEAYPSTSSGFYNKSWVDDGIVLGEFPSTNEDNKHGSNPVRSGVGPHVNVVDVGVGEITLEFVNPYAYWVCFERRSDGDVTQALFTPHTNPYLSDSRYPGTCVNNNVVTLTIPASQYVEIRLTYGAERDWDFDWTKFYVLPNTENFDSTEGNEITFTIPESSCHVIEYFAVDKFGNMEDVQRQFVMVDNESPEGFKEVGEPKILNQSSPVSQYFDGSEFDNHHYVTQNTPFTLSCDDSAPHPVEGENIFFKVYNNGDDITSTYCGEVELVNGYCNTSTNEYDFTFTEDSEHILKWYCEDALGNRAYMADQFYYVETVAPITSHDIIGPEFNDDGVQYINGVTKINLSAYDPDPHPSGLNETYYAWSLVDDAYCWNDELPNPFMVPTSNDNEGSFGEESTQFLSENLSPGTTLDDLFAGTGFSYTYNVTNGGTYNGAAPLLAVFELDDGRHVVLFPGWGTRTGVNTLTFSDNVAMDTGGNNVVDFTVYASDFQGGAQWTNGGSYPAWTTTKGLSGIPVDGTEEVVRVFFMHQGAGTGQVDELLSYTLLETTKTFPDVNWNEFEGEFSIPEESCHAIWYYSVDNLGNTENVKGFTTFVDLSAPAIDKQYVGEFFDDVYKEDSTWYYSKWIHPNKTNISLEVYDVNPHPSGLKLAEYRITQVDDAYCRNEILIGDMGGSEEVYYKPEAVYNDCNPEVEGDWISFDGSIEVHVGQESCHVIEVRAWDNVDKYSEHTQCVFVDGTAPITAKEISEPKKPMSENQILLGYNYFNEANGFEPALTEEFCALGDQNCMEVTLLTKIDLACIDQDPHPSGGEAVYFKVHWDADDVTVEYCTSAQGVMNHSGHDGYCYLSEGTNSFYFKEETWHRLEYYCEDNVGNVGEPDIEYFKVEGTAFEIELNKKWNLISVPVKLLDNSMDKVFENNDEVVSVWTYDGTDWYVWSPDGPSTVNTMYPGWGYWVLTTDEGTLTIGGSLFSPGVTPQSRQLVKGWNLIGYYDADGAPSYNNGVIDVPYYAGPNLDANGKEADCALSSLVSNVLDRPLSSLKTYWNNQWINLNANPDYDVDVMNPGAGYWLFYTMEGGLYAPVGGCPVITGS